MTEKHRPWGATTEQLADHADKTAQWHREHHGDEKTAARYEQAAKEYREGNR